MRYTRVKGGREGRGWGGSLQVCSGDSTRTPAPHDRSPPDSPTSRPSSTETQLSPPAHHPSHPPSRPPVHPPACTCFVSGTSRRPPTAPRVFIPPIFLGYHWYHALQATLSRAPSAAPRISTARAGNGLLRSCQRRRVDRCGCRRCRGRRRCRREGRLPRDLVSPHPPAAWRAVCGGCPH